MYLFPSTRDLFIMGAIAPFSPAAQPLHAEVSYPESLVDGSSEHLLISEVYA